MTHLSNIEKELLVFTSQTQTGTIQAEHKTIIHSTAHNLEKKGFLKKHSPIFSSHSVEYWELTEEGRNKSKELESEFEGVI